jgi:hypothetical protein
MDRVPLLRQSQRWPGEHSPAAPAMDADHTEHLAISGPRRTGETRTGLKRTRLKLNRYRGLHDLVTPG